MQSVEIGHCEKTRGEQKKGKKRKKLIIEEKRRVEKRGKGKKIRV